ncbi:thioredoxin family protein [Desulfosudis oleivorans]|uniref:Thioredoxin domain n=1 Tax=Desulfosudis oleivorans (strain DSM 6200 / JCM 39069 / Hxd3) TaxID=96561 RepID=A8ZYG4_DESOH|nr:thioredoxin family protein [Desulfosudis oleivorans]ABW68689.1 Thioredoxin domain [Desulfosudis oleivorans Hxd3]
MTRINRLLFIGLLLFCCAGLAVAEDGKTAAIPPVPTPGMVTMVDLGAKKCVPCKMMAPILVELEKEYAGRASIIFIDVWEHREQAPRFGIRGIPTQIFYDKDGKEVGRHVGFMDKKSIIEVFEQLGVPGEKAL